MICDLKTIMTINTALVSSSSRSLLLLVISLVAATSSLVSATLPSLEKAHNASLLWGTYRPGLYFGMRTRNTPDTLLSGLSWMGKNPSRLAPLFPRLFQTIFFLLFLLLYWRRRWVWGFPAHQTQLRSGWQSIKVRLDTGKLTQTYTPFFIFCILPRSDLNIFHQNSL